MLEILNYIMGFKWWGYTFFVCFAFGLVFFHLFYNERTSVREVFNRFLIIPVRYIKYTSLGFSKIFHVFSFVFFFSALTQKIILDSLIKIVMSLVLSFLFNIMLLCVLSIGKFAIEQHNKFAEYYSIDRIILVFIFMIVSIWAVSSISKGSYFGMFFSILLLIFSFRSTLSTLKQEFISVSISTATNMYERFKGIFIISSYWLLYIQLSLFFFIWNVNMLFPGVIKNGEKNANTSDLIYFIATSFTSFGQGDIQSDFLIGKLLLAITALAEFIYVLFVVNAFIVSYTAKDDSTGSSVVQGSRRKGRVIRGNRSQGRRIRRNCGGARSIN